MSEQSNFPPHQSALKLKKKVVEQEITPPVPKPKRPKKNPDVEPRKKKKPGQASGKFGIRFLGQSIGTFLVGMLIFGGFLYHQVHDLGYLSAPQAGMARGITVVAFLVILVIEAFVEDMVQGVLALFLPPYAFVYGLFFADAGPIRGLTMAMIVFLTAEVYLTPDNALVPKTSNTISTWINSGQDALINPEKHNAGFE